MILTSSAYTLVNINGVSGATNGETNSSGMVTFTVRGGQGATTGNIAAQATLVGFDLAQSINAETRSADADVRSVEVSISGLVDSSGNPDNILAGNESGVVSAKVTLNGVPVSAVVLFSVTARPNIVLDASGETNPTTGVATANITGDGVPGSVTVTAKATFPDGTEEEGTVVVQTSADQPTLRLLNSSDAVVTNVELFAASTQTLDAQLLDWNGQAISGTTIRFTADQVDTNRTSGTSNSSGEVAVTLTGRSTAGEGTLQATTTVGALAISNSITANSLGVDNENNKIALAVTNLGANSVLDGNEKATLTATVTEDGALKGNITVTYTITPGNAGTLSPASAVSNASNGQATTTLIGLGVAGAVTVKASATLSNGNQVEDEVTIQAGTDGPTLTLTLKNQSGTTVTSFSSNEDLDLEAVINNPSNATGALDSGDTPVSVTFALSNAALGTLSATTAATQNNDCGNSFTTNRACAEIDFTGGSTSAAGNITASATVNGISLNASLAVSSTGVNSGVADDNSFSITRNGESIDETVSIEGDQFNGQTATIQVDLADFFNNPVPDGTQVNFITELGDITASCSTTSGQCASTTVTFTSAEPRSPINTEVKFKDANTDRCPDPMVFNEVVTIQDENGDGEDDGHTDYRVKSIIKVTDNPDTTTLTVTTDYVATANGIECRSATCRGFDDAQITYRRLWLDEKNDSSSEHVIETPGVATEPFLDLQGVPCLAQTRSNLETITGSIAPVGTSTELTGDIDTTTAQGTKVTLLGSIDPTASTTVTGVNTKFQAQLKVGDLIEVTGVQRTVSAIASDTSLTVSAAFTDVANDTTPERVRGAVTGTGTNFDPELQVGDTLEVGGETRIVEVVTNDTTIEVRAPFSDLPVDTTPTRVNTRVVGVGTAFLSELDAGDQLKVNSQVRTVDTVYSDTLLSVTSAFATGTNDVSIERIAAPAYLGGMGQPYGGRSSILAYAVGEESFVDANANDRYDSGETFVDVAEPFLDKNGDGVFNDIDGDSDNDTTPTGPYEDNNTGRNPPGNSRDKSSPFCIGPKTVVNGLGGTDDSTEGSVYCHQAGGEEEVFVDVNSNGVWDTGNGIYNGSRCINQPTTVCSTTLVNISRNVEILMAGSDPVISWRVLTGTGGSSEQGERVTAISQQSGLPRNFRSSCSVTATDGTTGVTDFNVSNTEAATNAYPGVSERIGSGCSGEVPTLTTNLTSGRLYLTDRYGGRLPDNTKVKLTSSETDGGCEIAVNGVADASGTEFTVGSDIDRFISFSASRGSPGGSNVPIIATITTPVAGARTYTINCHL